MQTLGLSDSTPKPSSRWKDLVRPNLSNEVAARAACDSAFWACFIIGGLGVILSFFAPYASRIDAILFLIIGFGLRKGSRIAAVAGLCCS